MLCDCDSRPLTDSRSSRLNESSSFLPSLQRVEWCTAGVRVGLTPFPMRVPPGTADYLGGAYEVRKQGVAIWESKS